MIQKKKEEQKTDQTPNYCQSHLYARYTILFAFSLPRASDSSPFDALRRNIPSLSLPSAAEISLGFVGVSPLAIAMFGLLRAKRDAINDQV